MKIKESLKIKTEWKAIVKDAKTGQILRETDFSNVILDQFREKLIKAFAKDLMDPGDVLDDMVDKFELSYEQLGYDSTTASVDDTDLKDPESDTFKQISSVSYEDNEIVTLSFWDKGQAVGEWREFALYTRDELAIVRANITQNIQDNETLTINGRLTLI